MEDYSVFFKKDSIMANPEKGAILYHFDIIKRNICYECLPRLAIQPPGDRGHPGLIPSCTHHPSGPPRILVFSKTAGFHHASIVDGNAAIQNWERRIDSTSTPRPMPAICRRQPEKICCGRFSEHDRRCAGLPAAGALERYIQAGGGYVGIHAAADCEYDWDWYGRLVGGYFLDHPASTITFPMCRKAYWKWSIRQRRDKVPAEPWKRTDEYYSYKKLNKDIHVLLKIDETSYKGGHKMGDHPMAWYHDYDGGRAFYTELGHTKESYQKKTI